MWVPEQYHFRWLYVKKQKPTFIISDFFKAKNITGRNIKRWPEIQSAFENYINFLDHPHFKDMLGFSKMSLIKQVNHVKEQSSSEKDP